MYFRAAVINRARHGRRASQNFQWERRSKPSPCQSESWLQFRTRWPRLGSAPSYLSSYFARVDDALRQRLTSSGVYCWRQMRQEQFWGILLLFYYYFYSVYKNPYNNCCQMSFSLSEYTNIDVGWGFAPDTVGELTKKVSINKCDIDGQPDSNVPSKPEVLISPTVWQISLQFRRQTWSFRPHRARRKCQQVSTEITDRAT